MLRAAGLVGMITFCSRVFGLVRDMVIAACLGTTWISDVFLLAFEIPNLARRILGEGSLSAFIVPIFTRMRTEEGKDAAWRFASNALNVLALIALGLTALGIFLATPIFQIFGYGYFERGDAQAIATGVHLTRIMFPFLLLLAVSSLFMGLCHSIRHFTTPALGAIMLNICMILTGLIFMRAPEEKLAQYLAIAVLVGGLLRLLIMIPTLVRAGFVYRLIFSPRSKPMMQLFLMLLPALLGLAVAQINISVSRAFATKLGEGLVICLMLSNRIVQMPLGIVAASLATAILPQLSRLWIEKRTEELCRLVRFTFSMLLILFMPATVGLCVLGFPIIELIFKTGKWETQDSLWTYQALVCYALGLVVWGMMRILTPIFYADRDVKTPVRIGIWAMVLNLVLNFVLILITPLREALGHAGLALANTVAIFFNVLALMWILRRRGLVLWDRRLTVTFLKTLAASAVMGLFAWYLWDAFGEAAQSMHRAAGLAALLGLIVAAVIVYFGTALVIGVPDLREALNLVFRRLGRTRSDADSQ